LVKSLLKWLNFVGHSLGAITGVDVANIANRSIGNEVADQTFFNIDAVALANPGAEISDQRQHCCKCR